MDNKSKIAERVLILLMFFIALTFEDNGCCGRKENTSCIKCCKNYQLIDGTCQECPAGFWDNNCSIMCPHPYFGINCLQTCQCNERLCDNVGGCPDNTTMNNSHYTKSTSVVNWQTRVTTFKTSLETMAEKKGEVKSKKQNGSNKSTVFLAIIAVLALIVITIASLELFIGRKHQIERRHVVESHNL
ncbi:uncharacterized protein LOC111134959 isoform X2 [Crassostrea virginica]